ncbi:hypothetical protein M433DRAFT_23721 [Acidomyces richmondensis BFW]|nr:MAG: hypothetical protein FE78DRAFT_165284 [Acidomyces sp. 'richmondensis']KYG46492.1 hypothetical protein M433DRAFT_23721 [Acidomyces richmondensis BFW]
MEESVPRTRRIRARKSCEPCRSRKRKCDSGNPCSSCLRFEYDCYYHSIGQRRRNEHHRPPGNNNVLSPSQVATTAGSTVGSTARPPDINQAQLQSLEANSGAAFVRKLALGIDPVNAPRLHLFAWNLFMGKRTKADYQPRVRPISEILSRAAMESLAMIYLDKVDPCYGFIDREMLARRLSARWTAQHSEIDAYDAVLCGIAALGFLFSRRIAVEMEMDVVETAKHILEGRTDIQPGLAVVTGWMLRVAYLRMTASPHVAWTASCTLMHLVEAAGLTAPHDNIPEIPSCVGQSPELTQRMLGIARHLNTWISFDLGRSRVVLQNANYALPSSHSPGDYTIELLRLLSWSESLDPQQAIGLDELKTVLRNVLDQTHSEPPSVLAQTNLVLLVCRRLRALEHYLSGALLDDVLELTLRSLSGVQAMLNANSPWHHVANIPFQIVCILLAIDCPASIAQLGDAIRTLSNVAQLYNTEAAIEALHTACLLVFLQKKKQEAHVQKLAEILRTYSPASSLPGVPDGGVLDRGWMDSSWLDSLMTDMPNLQGFDVGQFFEGDGAWDMSTHEWV